MFSGDYPSAGAGTRFPLSPAPRDWHEPYRLKVERGRVREVTR
jgi:hypothetical protein